MSKLSISVFISSLYLLVLTSHSMAMTDEQKEKIHQHFHENGLECIKEHVISADDIAKLKAKEVATGPNVPCFLACMFKRIGIMDDSGMVNKESALELAKKVFQDPEEIQRISDFLHSCAHVNTAAVSDGDKGCDRAILSYKCMTENAKQAIWKSTRPCQAKGQLIRLRACEYEV